MMTKEQKHRPVLSRLTMDLDPLMTGVKGVKWR